MHRLIPPLAASVVLGAALVLGAGPAASASPPTERLQEFFGKVNSVLADPFVADRPQEQVARIRKLVADVADVEAAAARALGGDWDVRTAAERAEFTALFAEVLERAYVGRLAGTVRAARRVLPSYVDEQVRGSEATITTMLRGMGGHDMRADFQMTSRSGGWRVHDIVVDGVSTVGNYRTQFRRLLERGSYAEVVARMRAKLAEDSLFFARSDPRPPVVVTAPPPPEVAPPPAVTFVTAAPAVVNTTPEERTVAPPPVVRAVVTRARVAAKPRVALAFVATPAPVATPALAAVADAPAVRGIDLALWVATAAIIAGSGLAYVGWRAPGRS